MGGDEILPGGVLAAFGCRLDSVSSKDVAHRLNGNRVAEIGQGPDDAVEFQPEFSLLILTTRFADILSGDAIRLRSVIRCEFILPAR